ncbi:Hydroxyacylglutathione hydrolase [Granulibacter bethesdensis]|nr:Hydroxyacylglutathione hydrolase [Granulibacter bethesdensis]
MILPYDICTVPALIRSAYHPYAIRCHSNMSQNFPSPPPGLRLAVIPVTPFEQNCTLLWDEETNRGVVIDPGGDVASIMAAIDHHGVLVEGIWLTHGHLDHAGGVEELKTALQDRSGLAVPVSGPDRRDQFLMDSIARQSAAYGIPGMKNATSDRWLEEGDTLSIGRHMFQVLHCPGHTPGHIVLIHPAHFAIVGDVLFQGSVGRTDFPYGNTDELLNSIHTKLLPLGDEVAFLCGHGPGSTFGAERKSNPFLQ